MSDADRIIDAEKRGEDLDVSLRPQLLDEFTGQKAARENLKVFIEAAKSRGEALDHVLFVGPPGLGKTTLAQTMAKELGVTRMAMPTNGNAGAALAAYCAAADIEAFVFCPSDTPQINIDEIAYLGAHTFSANGLINDCGRIVGEGKEAIHRNV